jgi:hypothetical protein
MFDSVKALVGAIGVGIVFVFIVILGYFLVPTVLLIVVVGTSFLLLRDHYRLKKYKSEGKSNASINKR